MENNIQVFLPQDMEDNLKKYIYQFTLESIQTARKDAMIDKQYLKKKEACKWLGVSFNTFDKWEKQGLKGHHIDGIKLYSKKNIIAFIERH